MKYNFVEFEELFKELRSCVEYYERNYLGNKSFNLFLGNGQKIKYTIQPWNLPHLLGIKNITDLKTLLNIRADNTIEALKEISDRAYTIYNKINEEKLNEDTYFSKFMDRKIKNFKSNFTSLAENIINETEFVCEYKSERSWVHTENNKKYDYIIVKKLYNGKISLLGLVENQGQYYAMSNQLFSNMEEAEKTLDEYTKNQVVTLLTGINIYNIYTDGAYKKALPINQKLEKLDSLKKYKDEHDCFIDISSDYEYTIDLLRSNRTEKYENNSIIDTIVDKITKGKIIDRNNCEDSMLLAIVDAWNDHICNNPNNQEGEKTYTEKVKELNTAKKLITELTNKVQTLEAQNSNLSDENLNLKTENEQYEANEQAIMKILKPEN